MTSSADLPEGFLAEVFRNGCQCDHCVKWRAEVARLREAICELVAAESFMKNAQERWNEGRANTEQMGTATRRLHAANKVIAEIAREGR